MKRFISALVLSVSLLVLLSFFLFPPAEAKENVLLALLNLPAPAPPNPLVSGAGHARDPKFYNKSTPPDDNAPTEELLDYWRTQNNDYRDLGYNPKPSDRVFERIFAEIQKDPKTLTQYLNVLQDGDRSADVVKEIYDREGANGVFDHSERVTVKHWLTYHSPFFSSDLARTAQQAGDANEYVSNQEDLLALVRVDFDKAKPIIDRLSMSGPQKASGVLAKWALYRHALDSNSVGDIDTYRDQLKAVVEDKTATPGMRDLAIDALAKEKEWSGRDDWYYSLMGDETLADLRVNGVSYTGLTTFILYDPDEKYLDKMLELVRSDNKVVRAAAARNLVLKLNTNNPEIVRALIPWLEDPKWAYDSADTRQAIVQKLSEYEIPESVPGLIKILDEKQTVAGPMYGANSAANVMANAANAMANAANSAGRATNVAANRPANYPSYTSDVTTYPHRYGAVTALAKQKDGRAISALRRILPDGEDYERGNVVKALLTCGGFTTAEQLDALDTAAKGVRGEMDAAEAAAQTVNAAPAANNGDTSSDIAHYVNEGVPPAKRPVTAVEIKRMLGEQLLQSPEISDDVARGIVDRIDALETKDPPLAGAYRKMILHWQNAAINLLLLRDVKRGMADADTILRLLAQRKELREKQSPDVFDLRTGKPAAVGVAACLLEDATDYATILDNGDTETKTAMLACARLIRAPLPPAKVAESLKSPTPILQTAAERYLESEDSPAARSFVLDRHPNEARILGATTAFFVEGAADSSNEQLSALYQSLGDDSLYNGWSGSANDDDLKAAEKRLQAEVKKDGDLIGIYAYERNYVRIYKDRAIFSWDEDDSRYRERPLTKYEFDEIKTYLTTTRADELPAFLSCGGGYCTAKELVMLGRNGGRRVYINGGQESYIGGRGYDFFAGLDKYFADLKQSPSTLKYTLSREIPGLEILMASDDLHAETVWKEGNDLRIAASQTAVRKKVNAEIEDAEGDGETDVPANPADIETKKVTLRDKRRYEGYAWYRIADGGVSGESTQPAGVEFIPMHDELAVQPTDEQWKARAGSVEIRTADDGLFKAFRGKLTKLHKGLYSNAVVTPDGRWAVAYRSGDEEGEDVVRVDLVTNKEYPVAIEGYGQKLPSVFIPGLNRVLIVRNDINEGYTPTVAEGEEDVTPDDADPSIMLLLDPATGITQPIAGEFRPLSQQTFRPLQKASKPGEFWAAMPDSEKNDTEVGIYDTNHFGFRTVLRIPKIKFNSMNMWVDETAGKVYFVYRGHLLALPLHK